MSEKLINGLNEQFNFELESGYLYLSMSAYLKGKDMEGFANFMFMQAHEEFDHAMDFYNFLYAIDEEVEYNAIEKPKNKFDGFTELFKEALEHEELVTQKVEELYGQSLEEKNYKVSQFLAKYVNEQVEELDTFRALVKKFERVGENWNGLYILDRELSMRK